MIYLNCIRELLQVLGVKMSLVADYRRCSFLRCRQPSCGQPQFLLCKCQLNGEVFNDNDPIDIVVALAFAPPLSEAGAKRCFKVLSGRLSELADVSSKRVSPAP